MRLLATRLCLSGGLRVNSKLEWSLSLGSQRLDKFNIWDFKRLLIEAIEKRDGYTKGWILVKLMATIRSSHARARWNPQSMEDLSENEWAKVAKVIIEQAEQWRPDISVKIEAFAEVDKSAIQKKPQS